MNTVFMSYSHADSKTADQIASILDNLRINYFRDAKDIEWGDSITTKVREALDSCAAVIVIISPASLKSHWVPYELGHASALRKVVLPFLTRSSLNVPHYIRDLNFTTTLDQVTDYFKNIFAKDVKSFVPRPRVPTRLTEVEVDLLLGISGAHRGTVSGEKHRAGDARTAAREMEALNQLVARGLCLQTGDEFSLTGTGWDVADEHWRLLVLSTLPEQGSRPVRDVLETFKGFRDINHHIEYLKSQGLVAVITTGEVQTIELLDTGKKFREEAQRTISVPRMELI